MWRHFFCLLNDIICPVVVEFLHLIFGSMLHYHWCQCAQNPEDRPRSHCLHPALLFLRAFSLLRLYEIGVQWRNCQPAYEAGWIIIMDRWSLVCLSGREGRFFLSLHVFLNFADNYVGCMRVYCLQLASQAWSLILLCSAIGLNQYCYAELYVLHIVLQIMQE